MTEPRGSTRGVTRGGGEVSPDLSPGVLPRTASDNAAQGGCVRTDANTGETAASELPGGRVRPPSPRRAGRSWRASKAPRSDPVQPAKGARRLASLSTAAAYADVSTRTLRRYISQGRLTGYRVGPRLVKVDLNEVDRLAQPIPTAPADVRERRP